MKLKYYIDSNKGITFLAILGMMACFRQWDNTTAWVYLGMHGTYGILWVLKSNIFPDINWEKKTPLWFGLVSWFALVLYWIPAFLITWKGVLAPPWLLAVVISLYAFGVFTVFTADMQKFTALRLQPDQLITDGMLAYSRNINYFGELLIYIAFALLAMTWIAFIPLLLFIVSFWIPNIIRKEKILSKMKGYGEYKRKTRLFFPFIF